MAEILEKPERLIVVDDHRRGRIHAVDGEHMLDHPDEGFEWRRVGVDEAHTPQVEMDGSGNVTRRIRVRRPQIQQQRRLRI
jgi:hypothetical protein